MLGILQSAFIDSLDYLESILILIAANAVYMHLVITVKISKF